MSTVVGPSDGTGVATNTVMSGFWIDQLEWLYGSLWFPMNAHMISETAKLRTHDHPCLIYDCAEDHAAAFVPYLQSGLAQGERCLYIVDDSDPQWILDMLRSNNFDIDEHVTSGAFKVITKHDAYLKGGEFETGKMMSFWSDTIESAQKDGFHAVRAAAEMTWALGPEQGCHELVDYESHLNDVFPSAKISALCQYNRKRFSAQTIKDMIHVHPLIVIGTDVIRNPGFIPPDEFIESHDEMDVQALMDNLSMTKRLTVANAQLREALSLQQRSQQLLEEKNRHAESLYQELQMLAHVVSHELQAPLALIRSYLSLLSVRYQGRLGSDADEFIATCVMSSQAISKIADGLWDYARVENGARSDELSDSTAALNNVLDELREFIRQEHAEVFHDRMPAVPMRQEHLQYIFRSMIDNSLRYRSDSAPSIHITTERGISETVFVVSDNGKGINKLYSNDVFKIFFRIDDKPNEDGTGMALAVCRKIVEFYGGRIWVDTSPAGGARFYFTVPNISRKSNVVPMPEQGSKLKREQ